MLHKPSAHNAVDVVCSLSAIAAYRAASVVFRKLLGLAVTSAPPAEGAKNSAGFGELK